ncbi:hypothetical protein BC833DRAFT_610677 [Globomyces pollinis-pini]|nr:hypothetical protein BC833DRAFT_610677 [Globomyces pollinis-pini]
MPLESNGHHYCNIRHLGAVTDYNFVAFLADDKVCIDDYYRCFSNHSISVYSDSDCQGSSNNYFLPDTHQSISGLGEGSFLEIQGGKSIKSWINYVPGTLAAAPSLSFQGAMQNMLFIISFVLDASLLYYMVRKSYRGVTNFVIYGSITQFLWLIHNFVYAYFWRIPLPYNKINQRAQSILVATANFLLNIGTLLSTFHTLTVMNTLNNISRKRRVMQYVFLITTHIILAGGYYVSLCFKSDNDFSFCIPYHISRLWIRLHHLWMLFVFLWNLIPSVSIPMTICRIKHKNDTRYQLIKRIYDVDKTMVLMIFIQIGCAFIYWALGISASISNVFGDSYVVYTLIVFSVCIVSFHSFLNVLLLERLIETINLIHSGNAFGNFPQSATKSQTATKI